VDVITFAKGEPYSEPWIDSDRCAGADKKIASRKIAGYGRRFFLSEVALSLVWTESRRRSTSEGAVIVVILL